MSDEEAVIVSRPQASCTRITDDHHIAPLAFGNRDRGIARFAHCRQHCGFAEQTVGARLHFLSGKAVG